MGDSWKVEIFYHFQDEQRVNDIEGIGEELQNEFLLLEDILHILNVVEVVDLEDELHVDEVESL